MKFLKDNEGQHEQKVGMASLATMPAPLYPLLFSSGPLRTIDLARLARVSARLNEQVEKFRIQSLIRESLIAPEVLEHPIYRLYRPDYAKLYNLMYRCRDFFVHLNDLGREQLNAIAAGTENPPWYIAAIDGNEAALEALLGDGVGEAVHAAGTPEPFLYFKVAHCLVLGGHWQLLQKYIQAGKIQPSDLTDADARNKFGHPTVLFASISGDMDFEEKVTEISGSLFEMDDSDSAYSDQELITSGYLKKLIAEFDVDFASFNREKPYLPVSAAMNGHFATSIELLDQQGFPVDAKDPRGNDLLLASCFFGDVDRFELFRARGLSPEDSRTDGMHPIHCALSAGHLDMAAHCQNHGWGNARTQCDRWGKDGLDYLIEYKHDDVILSFLKRFDVNPLKKDQHGYNALHKSAKFGSWYVYQNIASSVQSSQCSRSDSGDTPFLVAASQGRLRFMIKFMSQYGKDCLRDVDAQQNGLMHKVCESLSLTCVDWVMRYHHGDLAVTNRHGETPLHYLFNLISQREAEIQRLRGLVQQDVGLADRFYKDGATYNQYIHELLQLNSNILDFVKVVMDTYGQYLLRQENNQGQSVWDCIIDNGREADYPNFKVSCAN